MEARSSDSGSVPSVPHFAFPIHAHFFKHVLKSLPKAVEHMDCNRMTILYFCVSGLDVLGLLEDSLSADEAGHIIKWVLSSHIIPFPYASTPAAFPLGDLPEGEPFVGQPNGPQHPFDVAHIAMTYSALCVLQILTTAHFRRDPTGSSPSPIGKSLPELVDVPAICGALRALQLPNGCFQAVCLSGESDIRFVFCACAISTLLGDWSGVDVERATDFVIKSQSYDGGFGQAPNMESHGGSTYCAVAALSLMGRLDAIPRRDLLVQWLLARQHSGFQGRVNKPCDVCYSWWVGASLQMLGTDSLVDANTLYAFVHSCESKDRGAFAKDPSSDPDLLHGYFGIAGLSLLSPYLMSPTPAPVPNPAPASGEGAATPPLPSSADAIVQARRLRPLVGELGLTIRAAHTLRDLHFAIRLPSR